MNHPQLDKARAWTRLAVANETSGVSRAASEVIQSLPDQWVDAEELREQVKKLRQYASGVTISSEACYAYHRCVEAIESLIPPPPPAGEPWIVERYGHKWVGVRNETNIGDSSAVWSLVSMEDTRTRWAHDYEISLVSRLVPEHKENA